MHSSRMRTARSLTVSHSIQWGVLPNPPWMQIPLDVDPLHAEPPGCRSPGCRPQLDADLPPVNRMAHGCKNITLPQTWLAGICNRAHVYLFSPSNGRLLISLMFSKWSWSRHCDWSGTLKVPPQGRQQTIWLYEWSIYEVLVNTKSSSGGSRICQTRGANFPKTA